VLALRARFEQTAAVGLAESYEFTVDGEVVSFDLADGNGTAHIGPAEHPAVAVAADAETFMALSSGAISAAEAVARGARIDGEPEAVARMRAVLPPRRMAITEDHQEAVA
jgi:hypothetical protein